MNWIKRFDPTGNDIVVIPQKYKERAVKFLKEAGFSFEEGIKYASEFGDPIVGQCWWFPATTTILESDDPQKN